MNTDSGREHAFYLPDFCTSRATLAIVLIGELTAFVPTLARQSPAVDFWTDLVRTSMFLLWIGLAGAALLCALRAPPARSTGAGGPAGGRGPTPGGGGPRAGAARGGGGHSVGVRFPDRSHRDGHQRGGRGIVPPVRGQLRTPQRLDRAG